MPEKSVTVHGVYNALQCLPPRLKAMICFCLNPTDTWQACETKTTKNLDPDTIRPRKWQRKEMKKRTPIYRIRHQEQFETIMQGTQEIF